MIHWPFSKREKITYDKIPQYKLFMRLGEQCTYDGEPAILGVRLRKPGKMPYEFSGIIFPEDVKNYVLSVGIEHEARIVTVSDQNVGKLSFPV